MVEASLIGLLRTLGIIFLIVVVWRILVRFLLPRFLKWTVKKTQEKMRDSMHNQAQNYTSKSEETIKDNGDVKITRSKQHPNQKKNNQDGSGEYVDFEEV